MKSDRGVTGSQVDPPPAPSVEQRLDMLMQVLCGLHEAEVITDPAVSASKTDEGTAVTVEFLLDSPRVAVVRPTRLEIEETIQRERGQDLRRWTPAGVVDILVEAGYLDVTE